MRVFVDTSAFLALANRLDQDHATDALFAFDDDSVREGFRVLSDPEEIQA